MKKYAGTITFVILVIIAAYFVFAPQPKIPLIGDNEYVIQKDFCETALVDRFAPEAEMRIETFGYNESNKLVQVSIAYSFIDAQERRINDTFICAFAMDREQDPLVALSQFGRPLGEDHISYTNRRVTYLQSIQTQQFSDSPVIE